MLTRDDTLRDARVTVRDAVCERRRQYSPTDLINHLRAKGVDEDQVRTAVWYLLDQREIELTADWKLDAPCRQRDDR